MSRIKSLSIAGFKSIQRLDDLELRDLNVLIGTNGAGKSNFISYFVMLQRLIERQLGVWTRIQGDADRVLSFGVKTTSELKSRIFFGRNGYHFCLQSTVDSNFIFKRESLYFDGDYTKKVHDLPAGQFESQLPAESAKGGIKAYCFHDISGWKVFHFHDTSATAGVKRPGSLIDNDYLRPDASNLAAFLFRLHSSYRPVYEQIRKTI